MAMDHLTRIHPETLALAVRMTRPGQAHWAVPFTTSTCRECAFWRPVPIRRWNKKTEQMEARPPLDPYDKNTVLRTRRCAKAQKFAERISTPRVPHDAWACRYFEPGDDVLPALKPSTVHEPA